MSSTCLEGCHVRRKDEKLLFIILIVTYDHYSTLHNNYLMYSYTAGFSFTVLCFFKSLYRTSFFRLLFSIVYSDCATVARPWSCCTALTANFAFSHLRKFYILFSLLGENYFLFPVLRPSLRSPHVIWSDRSSVTCLVNYAQFFCWKPGPFPRQVLFF